MSSITLLYDRDCGFCRWTLGQVLRWDRRGSVRVVSLQDPAADELLGGMDAERKMSSWHAVDGGKVYSGGAAVPVLLDVLPGGARLAALARRYPRATERLYRLGADNRTPLGKSLPRRLVRKADERIARSQTG